MVSAEHASDVVVQTGSRRQSAHLSSRGRNGNRLSLLATSLLCSHYLAETSTFYERVNHTKDAVAT
jgi:hypothetical protein